MSMLAGLMLPFALGGCSADGAVPPSSTNSITSEPASAGTVATGTSSTVPADLGDVFIDLADAARPMVVFAPTYVPQGTTLAKEWWPVAELADPASYEGPQTTNPRVLGSGSSSEIQVVLQTGVGWLVILENVQGDLGDVAAEPVGTVAGSPASLYKFNGGRLVKWSKDGLWYGVFGRGISEDEVTKTALGMQPLATGGP
jgi:hypothetical protein